MQDVRIFVSDCIQGNNKNWSLMIDKYTINVGDPFFGPQGGNFGKKNSTKKSDTPHLASYALPSGITLSDRFITKVEKYKRTKGIVFG